MTDLLSDKKAETRAWFEALRDRIAQLQSQRGTKVRKAET